MRIITPSGDRVPFSEIAEYEIVRGDVAINHLDGLREIQVNADLENPNSNSGAILDDIKNNVVSAILSKFSSVRVSYEGQSREAAKIQNSASKVALVIPVSYT